MKQKEVKMGRGVVYKDQWITFVSFFFSFEEGRGLRTIRCVAGICENNIPVVIPPNMQ